MMKVFQMLELREAEAWAMEGNQALHIHTLNHGHPLFQRFPVIAHLMDQDKGRLARTALALGVRVIKMERIGEPGQHVDLCGKPMENALAKCQEPELGLGV